MRITTHHKQVFYCNSDNLQYKKLHEYIKSTKAVIRGYSRH